MRIRKVVFIILGIFLSSFGGGMLFACTVSAVTDGFRPFHVYLSLFFSFGVIFIAGIAVMYFGLKSNIKSEESVGDCSPVQMPDDKTVKILLQELRKRTGQDAIKIEIDEGKKPTLYGSKIGGIPYWEKQREYPTASDGSKLMLLAQINLEELPENEMLYGTGILQFFILGDRTYGMSIQESGYPQNTYQVIYHDKVDESITEADVLSLGIRTSSNMGEKLYGNMEQLHEMWFPVQGEYAISFKMKKVYMNDCDVRCTTLLHKIAQELNLDLDSRLEFYQMFNEYDKRYADIQESTCGHWLFGYPAFRQWDPRSLEMTDYYDTLLFQLDSESWYGKSRVLWGDEGVGVFFINSKRLAEMDFSDVLYYWDCC